MFTEHQWYFGQCAKLRESWSKQGKCGPPSQGLESSLKRVPTAIYNILCSPLNARRVSEFNLSMKSLLTTSLIHMEELTCPLLPLKHCRQSLLHSPECKSLKVKGHILRGLFWAHSNQKIRVCWIYSVDLQFTTTRPWPECHNIVLKKTETNSNQTGNATRRRIHVCYKTHLMNVRFESWSLVTRNIGGEKSHKTLEWVIRTITKVLQI